MKHEKNTGDGEDDEEEAGDSSQTEGIGESKTMAFHLRWEDMEEKIVKDYHGSFQIGIRNSGSKDRTPHYRVRDPLQNTFFHLSFSL